MGKPKIGIILSTTREGRFAAKAADWLLELVTARKDLSFELVDLREYPLPFFDEPKPPLWAPPKNDVAQRWAKKIESFDGYVFVTAEYNHGVPAVLKNAIDYVAREFARKPAAYVGYGGVGAARAVEQLRLVNIEQQMAPLKAAVHIGGADFLDVLLHGKSLADKPHLVPGVNAMLDDLAMVDSCAGAGASGRCARVAAHGEWSLSQCATIARASIGVCACSPSQRSSGLLNVLLDFVRRPDDLAEVCMCGPAQRQ